MYTTASGLEMLSDSYFFGTRTGGTRMLLDSSGNLGLGVTPSGWSSGGNITLADNKAIGAAGQYLNLSANWYYSGGDKYVGNGYATLYYQQAGAHKWYIAPNNTSGAGATLPWTTAMTLDASGNLLVGNTTQLLFTNKELNVNAASGSAGFALATGGTARLYMTGSSSDGNITTKGAIPLLFGTNETERARITSGGEFLVNTANAAGTSGVGVALNPSDQGVRLVSASTTNSTETLSVYSTGATAYRFYVGWGGTVYATNTTISAISDQRFKENISDLDVGLDAVLALKPRKFDWKEGKGKDIKGDRGFIAQEFEQVFPDLVDEWRDPAPEGEEPYKSVRQDLIPVLVKAIQEQQAMIKSLEAKVAALESK